MNTVRFTAAFNKFDAANAEDPHHDTDTDGRVWPKELLYAHRMSACLGSVAPDATEEVQFGRPMPAHSPLGPAASPLPHEPPRLPPVAQHAQEISR